jgi:hypothetical protein
MILRGYLPGIIGNILLKLKVGIFKNQKCPQEQQPLHLFIY